MSVSKRFFPFILCFSLLLPMHTEVSADDFSLGSLAGSMVIFSAAAAVHAMVETVLQTAIHAYVHHKYSEKVLKDEIKQTFEIIINSPIRFSDVLGLDEVITEISESVDFLKNPQKYEALGARAPRGILLSGPPGTGKSLLAKAVAGEVSRDRQISCPVISVSASQFIQLYRGTGPMAVRELFTAARQIAPCIVFIDEIDSLTQRTTDERNNEDHNTVNAFLEQMDGLHNNDGILIIGATNEPDRLDKALLRPKRFDRQISVPLPRKQGRQDILKYYLEKIELPRVLSPESIAHEFASRTTGFSPAQLEGFVNEAALHAAREDADSVALHHFEQAYDRVTLGMKNGLKHDQKEKRDVAVHEIGHVIMQLATQWPCSKVSIIPRGMAAGFSFTKEKYESMGSYSKDDFMNLIMIAQGGYVAEKLFLKKTTAGAQNDLQKASELAETMLRCGMGPDELEGIAVNVPEGIAATFVKKSKEISDAISKILKGCMQKTEEILKKHQALLEALSSALLEREELSEEEIYEIAGMSPLLSS